MDWCGCFQLSGGNLFLKIGSKNLVWQGRMRVAPVQNRKFAEQLINFNNQVKTFFILKVRINFQQTHIWEQTHVKMAHMDADKPLTRQMPIYCDPAWKCIPEN